MAIWVAAQFNQLGRIDQAVTVDTQQLTGELLFKFLQAGIEYMFAAPVMRHRVSVVGLQIQDIGQINTPDDTADTG